MSPSLGLALHVYVYIYICISYVYNCMYVCIYIYTFIYWFIYLLQSQKMRRFNAQKIHKKGPVTFLTKPTESLKVSWAGDGPKSIWAFRWIPGIDSQHLVAGWATPLKNDGVRQLRDDEIPNIWENKKWKPNHQPADSWHFEACWLPTSFGWNDWSFELERPSSLVDFSHIYNFQVRSSHHAWDFLTITSLGRMPSQTPPFLWGPSMAHRCRSSARHPHLRSPKSSPCADSAATSAGYPKCHASPPGSPARSVAGQIFGRSI